MNRDTALISLTSETPAERLTAARYLQFWALPADVPILRSAISSESVGWVRRALESALQRLGDERSITVNLEDLQQDENEISDDIAAIARARITRTVVHELEPIVGVIQVYASRELDSYEDSQTKLHIDRLAAMLRAIETLGKISHIPRLESVDLTKLLQDVVESERVRFGIDIRLEGPLRLIVNVDPGLVRLIVDNGIRNACEATLEVADRATGVVVIYGATDREVFVSIADNGVGLPSGTSEKLFEMGTSTKEDHLGMGLTLCFEAARALGGNIRLMGESFTTRFELTVPTNQEGDNGGIPT